MHLSVHSALKSVRRRPSRTTTSSWCAAPGASSAGRIPEARRVLSYVRHRVNVQSCHTRTLQHVSATLSHAVSSHHVSCTKPHHVLSYDMVCDALCGVHNLSRITSKKPRERHHALCGVHNLSRITSKRPCERHHTTWKCCDRSACLRRMVYDSMTECAAEIKRLGVIAHGRQL